MIICKHFSLLIQTSAAHKVPRGGKSSRTKPHEDFYIQKRKHHQSSKRLCRHELWIKTKAEMQREIKDT